MQLNILNIPIKILEGNEIDFFFKQWKKIETRRFDYIKLLYVMNSNKAKMRGNATGR